MCVSDDKPKHAGKDIVISDLAARVDGRCIDATAPDLWRAVPYQTEQFSGVMLGPGQGRNVEPLTIRLGLQGMYRVWLGIHSFINRARLTVRLTGDLCSQTTTPLPQLEGLSTPVLYEVFWREADLAGQDLILEGPLEPTGQPGALAYLRLEPIGELTARIKRKVRYPLAITNDGHGIWGTRVHRRRDDLLEQLEMIPRDSCLRIFLWGNSGADNCNYLTKVGNYCAGPVGDRLDFFCDTYNRNLNLWQQKGWNSLQVVRDYAVKRDWEFYVYIRMEAFSSQYPFDSIQSTFFNAHPEYHCRDREGRSVIRLSYAHPAVQDHMLDLVREISQYEPHGLCFCFIRGVPLVLYEPIMVEGFKKRYDVDPRELDEFDPRWLEYQGRVITGFMEKATRALKGHQRLAAIVPGNEHDCRRWGLDVASWVQQGLIDDLYPVGQRFNDEDVHLDGPENLDFAFFNGLTGRERIRLIPMLYHWQKFKDDYPGWRELMVSFLADGADGYGVWDGDMSDNDRPIGDIGYEHHAAQPVDRSTRTTKLVTMNGFRFDRYHHYEVI